MAGPQGRNALTPLLDCLGAEAFPEGVVVGMEIRRVLSDIADYGVEVLFVSDGSVSVVGLPDTTFAYKPG